MGAHIFISYRNLYDEPKFALKLAADLKNRGIRAWIDKFDIQPGDDWQDALELGINDCQAMIAVISPDYVKSKYCKLELKRAQRLDRPIFPILLRNLDPSDWPIQTESTQYVDFRDWSRDDSIYQRGVKQLVSTIQAKIANPIGDIPNAEIQYLTTLIAELETHKGVLEYVDLAGQMDDFLRPKPNLSEEWGLEGAFSLLEDGYSDAPGNVSYNFEKNTIPLENIREALAQHTRFVLLGEPGAGKTTTLRRLALDTARKRYSDPKSVPLPLLLYLPAWVDELTPVEFVVTQLKKAGIQHLSSMQQNIFLYLDGLNEMGATGAKKAKQLRDWLDGNNAPRKVIVTSRSGDYAEDLDLKLPVVLTEAMDENRVNKFVTNYLGSEAEGFLVRIGMKSVTKARSIDPNSHSLFKLATNPYLLTALMVVYKSSPNRDLPHNNGSLFRRLVMALWEREYKRQTKGWNHFEQMEAILGRLAYSMIDSRKPVNVSIQYAIQYIQDSSLLYAASSANLLEVQGGEVRFFHQLMQEYFAATIVSKSGVERILSQPRFGIGDRLVGKWDRVIVAVSGISAFPDILVHTLKQIDPFLAAQCIASGINISDEIRRETLYALAKNLSSTYSEIRLASISAIGAIGDHDARTILSLCALRDNEITNLAAANALGKLGNQAAPELFKILARNIQSNVEKSAAKSIVTLGRSAVPSLLDALRAAQLKHLNAIWALGEIRDFSSIPDLLQALEQPDRWVRDTAAEALGKIAAPSAIPALENILRKIVSDAKLDKHEHLSQASVIIEALDNIGTPEALLAIENWKASYILLVNSDLKSSNIEYKEPFRAIPPMIEHSVKPDEVIRILIVDDMLEMRTATIKLLSFEPDFEVIGEATNGRQGVLLARILMPNIVLMDINMPDMDGILATTLITEQVPTAAVIILSIQNDPDYLRRTMLAGARNFLTQPFLPEELYNTIRTVHSRNKSLARQWEEMTAKRKPGHLGDQ